MALERLLIWFSPAFPIGAFSFSHGLEWAVETGDITDRESLERWLVPCCNVAVVGLMRCCFRLRTAPLLMPMPSA